MAEAEYRLVPGEGWCQNNAGGEGTTRKFEHCLSNDLAASRCTSDPDCVAYAYDDQSNNLVLYTSSGCTAGCSYTSWLEDRSQITQAGRGGQWWWKYAKCRVKVSCRELVDRYVRMTDTADLNRLQTVACNAYRKCESRMGWNSLKTFKAGPRTFKLCDYQELHLWGATRKLEHSRRRGAH